MASHLMGWAGNLLDSVDSAGAEAMQKIGPQTIQRSQAHTDTAVDDDNATPLSPSSPSPPSHHHQDAQPSLLPDAKERPSWQRSRSSSMPSPADERVTDDVPFAQHYASPPAFAAAASTKHKSQILLKEKDEEIFGLKKVWEKSREELSKLKKKHVEIVSDLRNKLHQQETLLAEKAEEQKQKLHSDRIELEALRHRDKRAQELVETLRKRQLELEKEMNELAAEKDQMGLEQSRRLRSLMEEHAAKERAIEEESAMRTRTWKLAQQNQLRDGDANDQQKLELAEILSESQRSLEESRQEGRRLADEVAHQKSLYQHLEAELVATKRQSAQDAKDVEAQKAAAEQKMAEAEMMIVKNEGEVERSLQRYRDKDKEIEALQQKLREKRDDTLQEQVVDLQARLQGMSQHLISRQDEIEKSSSLVASLQFELDQERHRLAMTNAENRRLVEANDEFAGGNDLDVLDIERGSLRVRHRTAAAVTDSRSRRHRPYDGADSDDRGASSALKHVRKALSNVDKAGARFGLMIRRYPKARFIFFGYILLLHLFVLLILSHFVHHESQPDALENALRPNLMPGQQKP